MSQGCPLNTGFTVHMNGCITLFLFVFISVVVRSCAPTGTHRLDVG